MIIILLLLFIVLILISIIVIYIVNNSCDEVKCNLPIDLSLGIPSGFDFWKERYIPQTLGYNYIIDEPISITKIIRDFMFDFRGVTLDEVILGNGSMQMINAYFYSVKQILGDVKLYHIDLTFHLVDEAARIYGIELTDNPDEANLEYICVINNPDGRIIHSKTNAKYKLYDYAYWYDGYTLIEEPYYPHNVDFVFSFSKIGLSGFRLGFLNLTHMELIPNIEQYMFVSTININSASYDYFINTFKNKDIIKNNLRLHTNIMRERWRILNEVNIIINEILNVQGGYILMRHPPSYYLQKGIIGLSEKTHNNELTRLNIMGDNFNCLIKQLLT